VEYTLKESIEYAETGKLESWLHSFLGSAGNNPTFSEGLKLKKRYFSQPIKVSLSLFSRSCGPEKNLKYIVSKAEFEKRVEQITTRLNNGWDMPPLIVNYSNGIFELNDGNHRYEALVRKNIKEYYVIFWCTMGKEYFELEKFLENLKK
jgi:hypothetical protein